MASIGSPPRAKTPSRSPKLKARKGRVMKKTADHPQYKEMIREALTYLKDKNGSSRQKILGYILSNFNMTDASEAQVNNRLKFALRSGVKHGGLLRDAEGVGVTGKFRLSEDGATGKRRRRAVRGKRRRRRRRRSPRKAKRTRRTRRRRSPVKRRRRKRTVRRRRRRPARKARATRRRRKAARSPRRKRRRSVIRRRRRRRARR